MQTEYKIGQAPWEKSSTNSTTEYKIGQAPWERGVEQPAVTTPSVQEQPKVEEEEELVPEMMGFSPSQIDSKEKLKVDMQAAEVGGIESDVNQVYTRYSTLAKQIGGLWDEDKRKQAELDTTIVKSKVLKELTVRGFENPRYVGDNLFVTIDGKEVEATRSVLRDILETKGELTGAIGGAIAGAKLAPTFPHPLGTLVSKGIGAAVGSATGVMAGSGIDTLLNDVDMVTTVSAKTYMDKMKDAGVADIILGAAGYPVAKALAITAKSVKHVFNLVANKNKAGAIEHLYTHFNITKDEAMEKVNQLEALIGPLAGSEEDKIIYTLIRTQRGGEGVVGPANVFNSKASAHIMNNITATADDLLTKTKTLSADNIQSILRQNFDKYTENVMKFYDDVKHAPSNLMEGYSFDYDKLGVKPIIDSIGTAIENPTIRQRYADLLTKIGNASEGRSFVDLIDLRQAVNEIKYATKTIKTRDKNALDNALKAIDDEIAMVTKDRLGDNAKVWSDNWAKAKAEYSKMKAMEKNVLYKVLTKEGIDEETVVKQLAKYIKAGDNTFYEVMEKLPKNVRNRVDGAVLNTLVEKFAAGDVGGNRAIHFPLLKQELQKVSWTSPKAKQLVRTINRMADVFKNDIHLAKVSGNINLEKFQSYLTADPVVRLKYEVASKIFNYVKMLAPGEQANALALVKNTGRILENPLNFKSIDELKRVMPKDTRGFRQSLDADPMIKDLQEQYIQRKQALEHMYGKTNMPPRLVWKKPLEAPTTIKESIDSVLYATERGTISDDATEAIMKDRTDDLISDFIWQNTTKENVDIVSQASKYMDNARFESIAKNVRAAMKVGERERNANMLKNIVNVQANQLIKKINKDFGVQLPKEEADKIIQLKFKELMEQYDGM